MSNLALEEGMQYFNNAVAEELGRKKIEVIYLPSEYNVPVLNTYMLEHISSADFFHSEIEPWL